MVRCIFSSLNALLLLLGTLISTSVQAEGPQSCTDILTVNAPVEWPPYSIKSAGDYRGLDIEIIKIILTEANLCWSFVEYPSSPRVLAELARERLDLVFAASYTPERAKFANYSKPYRSEFMSLFTHKNNHKRFSYYTTSTVVTNRGAYYGENFEVFRKRCPECLVEVNSTEQRIYFLKNQRVDFAVLDELTGKEAIKHSIYEDEIIATQTVIHKNDVHLIVRKSLNPDYLERLNMAIDKSRAKIMQRVEYYRQK